jgi:hypothetical protein
MARFRVLLSVCWLWLGSAGATPADQPASASSTSAEGCSATNQLVVLSGSDLMPLVGTSVRELSMLSASPTGLRPIVFQVDRRDAQGRYIIDDAAGAESGDPLLGSHDELVFLASDAGTRLSDITRYSKSGKLAEIRLGETPGIPPRWVYVSNSKDPYPVRGNHYVQYNAESDLVTSAAYQLGFDMRLPFLVDAFRWKSNTGDGWSPNIVDTMKIRHRGMFLGFIPFKRTHRDYSSRLTGVKAGPLRIIRRTENRIRVLWHLKTPAVQIDYVVMPGGFVMDTVIDIPFNVGLFFGGIETLTTVDWNQNPGLPDLTVGMPGHPSTAAINGHMSAEKHAFNLLQAHQFTVTSSLGRMLVSLEIPPGVPITPWLYLRDALNETDPPEKRTGQFGNIGFRTTGWEQINTQVQHVKFTVCLEPQQ